MSECAHRLLSLSATEEPVFYLVTCRQCGRAIKVPEGVWHSRLNPFLANVQLALWIELDGKASDVVD